MMAEKTVGNSKMKTIDKITKLKSKVAQLETLIEVTSIISSTLDLDALLKLVLDKAQSVMNAEASSILLINEKTGMLECEVALGEVGAQVKEKIKLEVGQGIGGWVAQTGEPLIVPDVSADSRFYANTDKTTGFKTRSILAVPLKVKEKVIGVAEVLNPVDGRAFNNDDLDLFITFSRQVALALENAKMHRYLLEKQKLEQQLEAAEIIQQSFMPQRFPENKDGKFSLWAKNLSAKSIGGDFFDFINFGDQRLGVIIGDVSGKGIPAALYMARLVSDFRFYAISETEPAICLKTINRSLVSRSRRGMFVTVQYLQIFFDTGQVQLVNGGHLPLIWYRARQKELQLISNSNGIPLGILKSAEFATEKIHLDHGDYLIMITDGVLEAKNKSGQQYSMQGLLKNLKSVCWENPQQIVDYIQTRILKFSVDMPQHDDLTIVALRWN